MNKTVASEIVKYSDLLTEVWNMTDRMLKGQLGKLTPEQKEWLETVNNLLSENILNCPE